jgi:hypothetical protein
MEEERMVMEVREYAAACRLGALKRFPVVPEQWSVECPVVQRKAVERRG